MAKKSTSENQDQVQSEVDQILEAKVCTVSQVNLLDADQLETFRRDGGTVINDPIK